MSSNGGCAVAGPDVADEALRRLVDDLILMDRRRVLELAEVRAPDHPLDEGATKNLLVVLQDLEMLASLRANLPRPG